MKKTISLTIFGLLLLTGCGKTNYLIGYSESLYNFRRNANEESTTAHIKFLEKKIAYAAERQVKTPPGLFLEMGYFYEIAGQQSQARIWFEKEVELYPESAILITKLLNYKSNPQ